MPMRIPTLTALALLGLLAAGLSAEQPDYTKVDLESLGIKPVVPKKDGKTGFVVGGKNATSLIAKLPEIAGRPIADLEKDMRPGALSGKGFLGRDERLLDVLAADNRLVVDRLGLSHQDLALHLHVLGALAGKHGATKPVEIAYHGRKLRLKATFSRGFQTSPFQDGTKTNCNAMMENLGNGKRLGYSLLVPYMIERYGFYEGKGTPYRVDPGKVLEVLDFLAPAKKR
jgi:hypothetical protein